MRYDAYTNLTLKASIVARRIRGSCTMSTIPKEIVVQEEVKMENLDVTETSAVDHPAHLHEGWVIMKSVDEPEVQEVLETAVTEAEEKDAEMLEVEELTKQLEIANARITELETKIVDAPVTEEVALSTEEMLKSVPAVVREMLEKANSAADQARTELRKERLERMNNEYVAKAASFDAFNWDAAEVGPMLRELAEIAPALSEKLEKTLVSLNEQSETAVLFAELGTSVRPDAGDAYGKIQTLAKSAVATGEFKTVEQAVSAITAQKPELYNEYLAEKQSN